MMRLTLSQSNSSLQTFEYDVNVSASNKAEVFKFLTIVVKNLVASDDAKFRQLRLQNAKIQRLTAHPAVMTFLQHVVGFDSIQENGESLLRIISRMLTDDALQTTLQELAAAHDRVESIVPKIVSNSSSASSLPDIALTEKQKARILAEEKSAAEREAGKLARKRTVEQLLADKHVRANDDNWKPSVSAAAAKSGDTMSTFRDKFGES